MVVPNSIPAEVGEAGKLLTNRGRESELVPEAAEKFGVDKKGAALKGEVAGENVTRGGFQAGVKRVPVL